MTMTIFKYLLYVQILGLMHPVSGAQRDICPPADPNCHPSCIVYTSDHCRYCRCGTDSRPSVGSSDWSSGMSTDQSWDSAISGGDWSSTVNSKSDVWGNGGQTGYGSSSQDKADVKYIIIENIQDTDNEENRVLPQLYMSRTGSSIPGPMSGPLVPPSAPFSPSSRISSDLLPELFSTLNADYTSSDVIHVPLISPGVPKYCVRCPILNCPKTCERVDDYGCHSCPCAPSRFQTMPISRDCSRNSQEKTCTAIERCRRLCKDGYKVGERDSAGCQTCSCIHYALPTTPKPKEQQCPGTLACMLKCKNGYILGEKMANGCPSCTCLAKGSSAKNNNMGNSYPSNSNHGNGFNNYYKKKDDNVPANTANSYWNTGSGSYNSENFTGNGVYSGISSGIGGGKCRPPMCLDGNMSVGDAMKIGESSAGNGAMSGGTYSSMTSGMMTSSGESTDTGNCYPMCASGSGGGMSLGGTGTSSGMTSGGGCTGPFCANIGGLSASGTTTGNDGKDGTGQKPFSPFGAAISGMGSGMGMPGRGGGSAIGSMSVSPGSQPVVETVPYNHGCLEGECQNKEGMRHKDCSQLVHCMMTCDNYMLGELDEAGCQTCICN